MMIMTNEEKNTITNEILRQINKTVLRSITSDELEEVSFEDLKIDSMAYVELIVTIEDQYAFTFEDDALISTKYSSLSEFVNYILAQISNQ